MEKRAWARGAITLALIGGLAAALIASPVVAFEKGDKKKVRRIATKKATKVFNNLIGPATTPFVRKTESVVAFQKDSDGASTATSQQVNTLSITAPAAGFLIISGQVDVDDDSTDAAEIMCLAPKVDGTNVVTGTGTGQAGGPTAQGEAACFQYEDATDTTDEATMSYTVVAAVAAGAHTVTQNILNETGATVDYEWFNGGLTAQYIPTGAITTARTPRLDRGTTAGDS